MSDTDLYKHRSDCAVHNEPAYPAGPCDCGAEPPTSNRKKLRQANLRVGRQREKIAELLRTIADLRTQLSDSQDRAERLEEALLWCGGSADFNEGGVAREGWLKVCAPLLKGESHD